ncbi:Phage integrase family protein [Mariniphaga anaerophila]|uniref:Phage integrase family protein n=1 Tax=Mariniphaga anaerophila TaxID=1484053 RepID=A0A1M5CE98_9BACT|nr:site-specific integrase [Mariniphaga anaerophila]SHF53068.1 Phage integrase family protein [Mariniphaga anaerophila]
MAKIGFHLNMNKRDKNNFVPIRAKISVQSKAVYKNLPFKIKVTRDAKSGVWKCNNWKDEDQKLYNLRKTDKFHEYYNEINAALDDWRAKAIRLFNDCQLSDVPLTVDLVKKFFAGEELNLRPAKKDFWKAYDEYLKFAEKEFKPNTSRMHKSNKKKLQDFEADTGYKLTFNSVNLSFFDELKEYILFTKGHEYNYLPAITKRLKAFMNWSYERKYHNNQEYSKLSASEKEGTIIYLTFDELKQLINFPFKNKTLQRISDFFCFGCLTGARYSDLNKLTRDNIYGEQLRFTTEKTNHLVILPIQQSHKEILNRYSGQFKLLPNYQNQSLNRYLKKACKEAGIVSTTENILFKKNRIEKEYVPKYELIGSHTARKTFICQNHARGMDIPTIMACTGIKNVNTIRRYLEVSTDTIDNQLKKTFDGLVEPKEKEPGGIQ